MPLNIPTITRDDVSFGPAILFLGLAGATPLVDIGAISEDGITLESTSEMADLVQGNPKLVELSINQAQNAMLRVTGMEWKFDNFARALNSGVTTVSASEETFAWGGEPCPVEVALHVQHQMCRTGHTMNLYVWRAVGEGNLALPFIHDFHNFEFTWKAQRAATEWDGTTLPVREQLWRVQRVKL